MTSSPVENNETENKAEVRCSKFDFSIDHILNRAGNSNKETETLKKSLENTGTVTLPWLNCTRYCPPKIPRNQKREGPQKRQLGRHPRIPFTSQQLAVLEDKFTQTPYLSSAEVTKLSRSLQLADIRVKIWFQNRRARARRERSHFETEQNYGHNASCFTITTSATNPLTASIKLENSEDNSPQLNTKTSETATVSNSKQYYSNIMCATSTLYNISQTFTHNDFS